MVPSLRSLLLGRVRSRRRAAATALAPVAVFGATFAAYALGVFSVAGCVVFVPGHAALLGGVAAAAVGGARGGLLPAWLVAVAALLGFRADHAFLGLSGRSFPEQLAYFLQAEGLVVFGVMGAVLGGVAFVAGSLGRVTLDELRRRRGAGGRAD